MDHIKVELGDALTNSEITLLDVLRAMRRTRPTPDTQFLQAYARSVGKDLWSICHDQRHRR